MYFYDPFSISIFSILYTIGFALEAAGLIFYYFILRRYNLVVQETKESFKSLRNKNYCFVACWMLMTIAAVICYLLKSLDHNNPLKKSSIYLFNAAAYVVLFSQICMLYLSITLIFIRRKIQNDLIPKSLYILMAVCGIINVLGPIIVLFYQLWQQIVCYIN